ncbi:MAG: LptE family protein [Pirellulaceae bacterium]
MSVAATSLRAIHQSHRLHWAMLVATPFLLLAGGCMRYQLGNANLYNPNLRTVYVPVIRNDTFRHNAGVQLTEAVHKAIELRTPYKVVADPSADSTLTCRVTSQTKRTLTQNATDEPRAVETLYTVEVTWTDRQGNLLMENRFVPLGELAFYFIQGVDFVPEGGQSIATAQQRAMERLAEEIVNQMETRW